MDHLRISRTAEYTYTLVTSTIFMKRAFFKMASPPPKNKPTLNVQSFPRPPLLEKTPRHLQIKWNGVLIADTKDAYWVLETHHPPSASCPLSSPRRPFSVRPFFWPTHIKKKKKACEQVKAHSQTSAPTAYYLPPGALRIPLTKTPRRTWCEWKGAATYWAAADPTGGGDDDEKNKAVVGDRIWSYERPTAGFEAIKDHLSFYAGPWDCFVDGERVVPQPGDFYGGWVTSDIGGIVKGRNGNWDPVV